MTYAHRLGVCDADTHMMETADWIARFADPDIRDRLEPFAEGRAETRAVIEDALARFEQRRTDPAAAAADEAAFMSMRHKGWHGLGAFDGEERRRANDLLGLTPASSFLPAPTIRSPQPASRRCSWAG